MAPRILFGVLHPLAYPVTGKPFLWIPGLGCFSVGSQWLCLPPLPLCQPQQIVACTVQNNKCLPIRGKRTERPKNWADIHPNAQGPSVSDPRGPETANTRERPSCTPAGNASVKTFSCLPTLPLTCLRARRILPVVHTSEMRIKRGIKGLGGGPFGVSHAGSVF